MGVYLRKCRAYLEVLEVYKLLIGRVLGSLPHCKRVILAWIVSLASQQSFIAAIITCFIVFSNMTDINSNTCAICSSKTFGLANLMYTANSSSSP